MPTATKDAPSKVKFGDFKQIVGTTNSTLYVLETDANYSKSMKLLDKADLRPLKYQEVLSLLMKDDKLKKSVEGKGFWLAGKGLYEGEIYPLVGKGLDGKGIYTINEGGDLARIENKKLSLENRVHVFGGSNPLSLEVYSYTDFGWRFKLDAGKKPQDVEDIVVGVPKSLKERAKERTKE
jgi:hypothetical protein